MSDLPSLDVGDCPRCQTKCFVSHGRCTGCDRLVADTAASEFLRERMAAQAHRSWSGWMQYLFGKTLTFPATRHATIPEGLVDRWKRQMHTSYEDLPDAEKQSDHVEADLYLEIVQGAVSAAVLAEREACAQLVETTPVEACNCKTCMHDLAAAIRARGEREAT